MIYFIFILLMIYAVILLLRFIFTFTYYKREKERRIFTQGEGSSLFFWYKAPFGAALQGRVLPPPRRGEGTPPYILPEKGA